MKDDEILYDEDDTTSRRKRNSLKRDEEYADEAEYDDEEDGGEAEYDEEEYEDDEPDDEEEEYDEDGDDGEEYDEDDEEEEYDEEPDDEEDEYDEGDDDVFSLEEDLKREQRKQFIQYICVALAALAIIAFALFAGIKLTQKRVDDEKNAAMIAAKALEAQKLADQQSGGVPAQVLLKDWPASEFPSVPVFDSPEYETTLKSGYAKIAVPSSATAGYGDYIDLLADEHGAMVYIKSDKLCVLDLDGVEIHLLSGNQQNRVVLCDEDAIDFSDVDYRAFDLPTGFKLVSATADSAMGRVLVYRLASIDKALEYANSLTSQYGWKLAGSFDMSGQTFYAVYTKNNLQMTLDYFSSSDDFTIKLDYVN